jgi:hypothetical protein
MSRLVTETLITSIAIELAQFHNRVFEEPGFMGLHTYVHNLKAWPFFEGSSSQQKKKKRPGGMV